jgi:methionyl-tRNA synthetase
MTESFYITTPIYYVNDRPHIGHAYTSVACDVLARFMRLDGRRVKFLTGTDEHGQKVEKSAAAAGLAPKAFVDEVSQHFRDLTQVMNISNDDFIRTTDARHIKGAQGLWRKMQQNGHIYLGSYAGWYAVRDEAFYGESELVDGKAPTGAEVEWVEEPSYFFRLSAFEDRLLAFYEQHPDFIMPASRRNEVISFVKGGLKDLSISRTTFKWGIPVPDCAEASLGKPGGLPSEASAKGGDKHIMYVWLDALTNYLSAIGYPDTEAEEYKAFWPGMHMVGKDILRFHAVYWPAFLMAADMPCPTRVFAHGWWTIEGEKMSKSLGNAVAPADLVAQYGLDQTRYFLMREVPFGNDGNFSKERMASVINSELANNIGNLVQRTLSMINKNCEGKTPSSAKVTPADFFGGSADITTSFQINYENIMLQNAFDKVLQYVVFLASNANEYIDTQAPWKLKKENPERMEAVLYCLADRIRTIAIMLQPFMPDSASRILDQLAIPEDQRMFRHLSKEYALKPGTPLPAPEPVFPRLVEKKE